MLRIKSKPITVLVIEIEGNDLGEIAKKLRDTFEQKFFSSGGLPFLIQAKEGVSNSTLKFVEEYLRHKGFKPLLQVPESGSEKNLNVNLEEVKGSSVLVVRKDLRSGQIIEHFGDVILIGDLNPGAEIRASGNIIVFGKLRGIAWAGYPGNTEAVIVAGKMEPQQLRIANIFAVPEEEDRKVKNENVLEMASVEEGEIVIKPLV